MTRALLLASNNPHKLVEFRQILEPLGYRILGAEECGVNLDVDETGATFEENARLKAETFCDVARVPTLADDSGLVVDALNGDPGIFSARYGGPGLSDVDRLHLVLQRLEGVPEAERTARFVAAIAFVAPGLKIRTWEGTVEGRIAASPSGSNGFGYDPIFLYPPAGRTFAAMRAEEKAAVSHRGRALAAAVRFLAGLDGTYT